MRNYLVMDSRFENKGRGIMIPHGSRLLRNFVESMVAREINPLPPPLFLYSFLLSRCHPFVGRVPLYTRVLTENI